MKRVVLVLLALTICIAPRCQKTRSTHLGLAGYWPPGATETETGSPTGGDITAWFAGMEASADHLGIHAGYDAVQQQIEIFAKDRPYQVSLVTQVKGLNVGADCLQCLRDHDRILSNCLQPPNDSCATSELLPYAVAIDATLGLYKDRILSWCVGNEIESEPNLPDLAVLADTLLAEIMVRAPDVVTCTVFQYERALKQPDPLALTNLFLRAKGIAATTYPSTWLALDNYGWALAEEVPANYYDALDGWAKNTGKVPLITEFGWDTDRTQRKPHVPEDPVVADGVEEQRKFYKRLTVDGFLPKGLFLFNGLFLWDLTAEGTAHTKFAAFDHMGLCRWDDPGRTDCRPAYQIWQDSRRVPYKAP